ncbi:MAG: hypothetical protein HKN29_10970 [Rhodothermales bacterium]|nr:hypothetical protein [Rhodothermales bacterium]
MPFSSPQVGTGSASLDFAVVEEDGTGSTGSRRVQCVDVLVLNPATYADTLAFGRFQTNDNRIVLKGLRAGLADIIVDVPGYFPAKFTDITLNSGLNSLSDKVLMFKSTVAVALPGHLGLTLRESSRLPDIADVYGPFGRVRVKAAPGGHYELKIPFRGVKGTRRDVEALLGRLVRSPHVETARPLVSLSAVIRSG